MTPADSAAVPQGWLGTTVEALSRRLVTSDRARRFRTLALRRRRSLVVAAHLGGVALAGYLAFWLRFDGNVPAYERELFMRMLPWLLSIRGVMFIPFRLYEGVWRYTGIYDLRNLLLGVASSSLIFYILVHGVFGLGKYPRSVFIIDAMLLIFFMGGIRLTRRITQELSRRPPSRRVLIYGAGDAGEMVVRDMKRFRDYQPIGFIDDDRSKLGQRIHGFPVLGTGLDLPRILVDHRPDEVLVAIPTADAPAVRRILRTLEPHKLPITTVPRLRDLLNGHVELSQIRPLSIEDLLPRAAVGLDAGPLEALITGRRVMVTGAGGSIGSELCRQIAEFEPSLLVLYERHENSLYVIENSLRDQGVRVPLLVVVGDVTDEAHLDAVLAKARPHLVFHAAAHKHVPLMEVNACEAVKNNITGTRRVAEAAVRHSVDRFVLISTDKAVNPSSVMGATKRVAELAVLSTAQEARTSFVTVRFGNVLGSNGSVMLRFLDQIKAGGPVTVTHPEMRRYFMLIPEAVQLVLHAAALGEPGALYTLDMGDQLSLVDMARNLIRLAGFVPEDEIAITFIGLRPGEKLSEELVASDETLGPSAVDNILRVRPVHPLDVARLLPDLTELERLATTNNSAAVLDYLGRVVPTFQPTQQSAGTALPPTLPARNRTSIRMPQTRVRSRVPLPDRVFKDKRSASAERRSTRRGGRRLTDLIGLDPAALIGATATVVPAAGPGAAKRRLVSGEN